MVRNGKQMGDKLPGKPASKSQKDKFREAARELGADVPEVEFDRALKQVSQIREKSGSRIDKKKNRRD